jgi:hypothetical protein
MKKKPEYVEGNEALENFQRALGSVISVPRSESKSKLEAEKKEKAERPKRKRKQSDKK